MRHFIPLPCRLVYDVFIVVISQAPRKFLVVHFWFIFPESPPSRHLQSGLEQLADVCHIYLVRVRQLKLPAVSRPGDELLTRFVREEF